MMDTLKEMVNDPRTIIVDVRNPWEFEAGHVPGARNIPVDEITYRLNELRSLEQPVVLYCRSGARSGMAVSILKQNGFPQVYNGGSLADMQYLLN